MSDYELQQSAQKYQGHASEPQKGLLERAGKINELQGQLDEMIRDHLDKIRGTNVKHLATPPEAPPNGLPGMLDQIERHLQSCIKQMNDLMDMF